MRDVTLQSFGASRTVTGSRHLLAIDQHRLLLDCGLFQGPRRESFERNRHLPFRPDAVLLSHAHIDHSGALPALVRGGFRGPIHATETTIDLCRSMLRDSARLNQNDVRHLNKRRRKDQPKLEPLYTEADVERTLKQMVAHRYDERFQVFPGVEGRFQDAGHIIGSAGVLVDVDQGPDVYFTGDVGRRMYPILRDPEPMPEVDAVISECTYGTRDHPDAEISGEGLLQEIRRTIRKGGKLLIPAFSVGRAQNLVYAISRAWHEGTLPRLPVYVDSPLAERATEVFSDHPELWDKPAGDFYASGGRPFYPKGVTYLETRDDSMSLNGKQGPFVVIAGSGMAEGGRIVHHLKHSLRDPRTTVLIVGWCAPHTLGRRLLEGESPVRVLGRWTDVNARVARLNAYSAHAGKSDLMRFLDPAKDMEASVFLVHGEEDTALAFAGTLWEGGHKEVTVPETYAVYDIVARKARAKAGA